MFSFFSLSYKCNFLLQSAVADLVSKETEETRKGNGRGKGEKWKEKEQGGRAKDKEGRERQKLKRTDMAGNDTFQVN